MVPRCEPVGLDPGAERELVEEAKPGDVAGVEERIAVKREGRSGWTLRIVGLAVAEVRFDAFASFDSGPGFRPGYNERRDDRRKTSQTAGARGGTTPSVSGPTRFQASRAWACRSKSLSRVWSTSSCSR